MEIRPPWENAILPHDEALLAQLATQQVDVLSQQSQRSAAVKPAVVPAARGVAGVASEAELAQEVSFAEVLHEMQSHPRAGDGELPPAGRAKVIPAELVRLLGPSPSPLRSVMDASARVANRFVRILKRPR